MREGRMMRYVRMRERDREQRMGKKAAERERESPRGDTV